MRMADVRKGLQVDDKLHFIDAVVLEGGDFLPNVEVSMDVDFVIGFRNAWPFDKRFDRDDCPISIIDMPSRLKILYEEVELFPVKLLVQCLGLATEKVEFP